MNEKTMKNSYITAILKTMNDEIGKGLYQKRLPVKLLYALRRSLPEIEDAYKTYLESLSDICNRYGVTPEHPTCEDAEQTEMLQNEIKELMNTETVVRVHTILPEVLDGCGEGSYDSLTFAEIDRVWWLIED